MYKLVIVGTIAAFAAAHKHPVNPDIVNEIKQKASTWTPMEVHENPLSKLTIEQVKGLLGTQIREPLGLPAPAASNSATPTAFDSRTQWGDCVHPIRDQQQCGSCWAFGATEALSDRFCIAGTDVVLSPEDLVACDGTDMGCNGGWLGHAWKYLTKTGAVSDGCFPYTSGTGTVPHCLHGACTDSHVPFVKYRCQEGSVVEATTPDQIRAEIYAHGPMETAFNVYSDFMSYKGGIYKHTSGDLEGGHAIKILGYGVENGQKYWLCANSWGTSWGESGFFRIAEGECGIDSAVYACTPDTTNHTF